MQTRCLLPLFLLALQVPGCKAKIEPTVPYFQKAGVPLALPQKPGWALDSSLAPVDPQASGIVMRLVREGAVPGSPRIDVVQNAPQYLQLEAYVQKNLSEMKALETGGQIKITQVQRSEVTLNNQPAVRVHHE